MDDRYRNSGFVGVFELYSQKICRKYVKYLEKNLQNK